MSFEMNDGHRLPRLGFGTYPLMGEEAVRNVAGAVDMGYRLIDTAVNYQNEEAVGAGLVRSSVDREEVVVATKLPGRDHGFTETLDSFQRSRRALGVDYVDLYLIHWPNPSVDKYVDTWRAMIKLKQDGLVRSIGVSNFTAAFLERLRDETGVLPAVNQIELHPFFPQVDLRDFHAKQGIVTQAWSPFGKHPASLLTSAPIATAAAAHSVTAAQIVLKWHSQIGSLPLPKSADRGRQRENLADLTFELSAAELDAIASLSRVDGRWFGGDPESHEEM